MEQTTPETQKPEEKKEGALSLTSIVTTAIQLPGVKVNRDAFLREQFKDAPEEALAVILEKGPVAAGCKRKLLEKKATALINSWTLKSTGMSFVAGIPGGLAMAATIPADMMQFYAVALRLAQELAYLYGESDLWQGDVLDGEKVHNQLILYCGVMLGASGAAQTVRVVSSALAQRAIIDLPKKALTKNFIFRIVKSITKKVFGKTLTKSAFGAALGKAIPVVGGVISGGITFASMKPMGKRLADTLEEAHFDYTPADFESDWQDIVAQCEEEAQAEAQSEAQEQAQETPTAE